MGRPATRTGSRTGGQVRRPEVRRRARRPRVPGSCRAAPRVEAAAGAVEDEPVPVALRPAVGDRSLGRIGHALGPCVPAQFEGGRRQRGRPVGKLRRGGDPLESRALATHTGDSLYELSYVPEFRKVVRFVDGGDPPAGAASGLSGSSRRPRGSPNCVIRTR
jgi:hypothetical protein